MAWLEGQGNEAVVSCSRQTHRHRAAGLIPDQNSVQEVRDDFLNIHHATNLDCLGASGTARLLSHWGLQSCPIPRCCSVCKLFLSPPPVLIGQLYAPHTLPRRAQYNHGSLTLKPGYQTSTLSHRYVLLDLYHVSHFLN